MPSITDGTLSLPTPKSPEERALLEVLSRHGHTGTDVCVLEIHGDEIGESRKYVKPHVAGLSNAVVQLQDLCCFVQRA